jgi:hypothetical protein
MRGVARGVARSRPWAVAIFSFLSLSLTFVAALVGRHVGHVVHNVGSLLLCVV